MSIYERKGNTSLSNRDENVSFDHLSYLPENRTSGLNRFDFIEIQAGTAVPVTRFDMLIPHQSSRRDRLRGIYKIERSPCQSKFLCSKLIAQRKRTAVNRLTVVILPRLSPETLFVSSVRVGRP